ncbi:MAG: hypothetical protein LBK42_08625 [Propionibacteriaceae bacterium]|jgi:hypothetical protein|nr:hypothetical protein [Propionibacteriaceae bacterium]
MDIAALAEQEVANLAPRLDAALAEWLSELVDAGEPEQAMIGLVENAPEAVSVGLAAQIEEAFVPGTSFRPVALKALARFRERQLVTA